MTASPIKPQIEDLLAHAGWVRKLASQLVADTSDADDLVQDTWVAALRSPPRSGENLRGWLARVMSSFAFRARRGKARRSYREELGARPEEQPSAGELLDRVQARRGVVEAVLELKEPYRSTVLLRYFEGLPPRAIASGQGVPVNTVRSRLARALDMLRTRLNRTHGFEGGWAPALSPLMLEPHWKAHIGLGVVLMNTQAKIVCAIVAFLIAGAGVWWVAVADMSAESGSPAALAENSTADSQATALSAPQGEVSSRSATSQPGPSEEEPTIHGTVEDANGEGVGGIQVFVYEKKVGSRTATDQDAAFSTDTDAKGAFTLPLHVVGTYLHAENEAYSTVISPKVSDDAARPVIIVAPRVAYAGIVVDEEGVPLESIWVSIRLSLGLERSWRLRTDGARPPEWISETNKRGEFRFESVGWCEDLALLVDQQGYERTTMELPPVADEHLQVVLKRTASSEPGLHGKVVNAEGEEQEGAWVGIGEASTRSIKNGLFYLPVADLFDDDRLLVLKEGYAPNFTPAGELRTQLTSSREDNPFVIVLDGPPLSLKGRVLWSDGSPVADALVWTFDGTPLRVPRVTEGGVVIIGAAYIEQVLAGRGQGRDLDTTAPRRQRSGPIQVRCDAAGQFELGPLVQRSYTIHALYGGTCSGGVAEDCAPDGGIVTITLDEGLLHQVAGVVRDTRGNPLEGVYVKAMKEFTVASGATWTRGDGNALQTNADGEFSFTGLDVRDTSLQFFGSDVTERMELVLRNVRDLEDLEITVPVVCRFQIVLNADSEEVTSFTVLDAEGKTLMLRYRVEGQISSSPIMYVIDGRSEVIAVSESAHLLVLRNRKREAREIPIQLKPGEITKLTF